MVSLVLFCQSSVSANGENPYYHQNENESTKFGKVLITHDWLSTKMHSKEYYIQMSVWLEQDRILQAKPPTALITDISIFPISRV